MLVLESIILTKLDITHYPLLLPLLTQVTNNHDHGYWEFKYIYIHR